MGLVVPWKTEDIEFVLSNYGKMSAAEIGRAIGKTRNAIIGKAGRLGLVKETPHLRISKYRKPGMKKAPKRREGNIPQLPKHKSTAMRPRRVRVEAQCVPKPESLNIPLVDIKKGQCRWMDGDPHDPNAGFCGHKTWRDTSY